MSVNEEAAELEEDIDQIRSELEWAKHRLIQIMFEQDELDHEERSIRTRHDVLKQDLADAETALKEWYDSHTH